MVFGFALFNSLGRTWYAVISKLSMCNDPESMQCSKKDRSPDAIHIVIPKKEYIPLMVGQAGCSGD